MERTNPDETWQDRMMAMPIEQWHAKIDAMLREVVRRNEEQGRCLEYIANTSDNTQREHKSINVSTNP